MTTTEIIVWAIIIILWFLWIGYIQFNHNFEMEKLDAEMKEANKQIDEYMEALDNAINEARTCRSAASQSTDG